MNRLLTVFLLVSSSLMAWEDHPDNDNDRRESSSESSRPVDGGYDWSNRDPDSKDENTSNSGSCGTMLSGPDRDK